MVYIFLSVIYVQVLSLKSFNLLISSQLNLFMEFTDEDTHNALSIIKRIENFCDQYDNILYDEVITITVTYCIDYVRRRYFSMFAEPNPTVAELMSPGQIGAAATVYFMGAYEMRQGAHDFLYFQNTSWPKKISDGSYTWKTSVGLLVAIHCTPGMDMEDLAIFTLLLPSIRDSLRDETNLWVDISLFLSMEDNCILGNGELLTPHMIETSISQLSIPFKHVYAAEYASIGDTTDAEQYDFLLEMAYSHDCSFFFILQEHLYISSTNWIFNSVNFLLRSNVLPWDIPFGVVYLHANLGCSDGSGRTCATGVALSRSHVEIFRDIGGFSLQFKDSIPYSLYLTVVTLMDIYRPFNHGVMDMAVFEGLGDNSYLLPAHLYQGLQTSFDYDYPLEIFYLRHRVARWLYTNSPFRPSLKFSDRSLLYSKSDAYFHLFASRGMVLDGEEGDTYEFIQQSAQPIEGAKVAVITAVFGGYEIKLQRFAEQTVPTDFICFTDMAAGRVSSHGWIIDNTPYHLDETLPTIDTGEYVNSIKNNKHPMNIGKFYKQFFFVIPRMQQYDHVIWIDGSIVLEKPDMVSMLQALFAVGKNLILFEHWRNGTLGNEAAIASASDKYNSTEFNGIPQPLQDIPKQYAAYLQSGYDEQYWQRLRPDRPQYGVWITCFIAFDMIKSETRVFLQNWYLQTLMFSTQDQVGFSYAAQMSGVLPYSFPDRVNVNGTALLNTLYRKYEHGK